MELEFKGKNILLVDDSIARGTTSKQIIQMAREAGAKMVYFASAAPPVRYTNVYGIDMPSVNELVHQDLDDLIETARRGDPKISRFDTSMSDGIYVPATSPRTISTSSKAVATTACAASSGKTTPSSTCTTVPD